MLSLDLSHLNHMLAGLMPITSCIGHGGDTNVVNLVSLCRPHHRRVHEQGWRIHIADGIAVVEPPP